ncbi:MAG: HD-GYP domain-containing protein [Bacillota bacterium]
MHKLLLGQLRPGTTISADMYDTSGRLLLKKGTVLTPRVLQMLRSGNSNFVYLNLPPSNHIMPPRPLPETAEPPPVSIEVRRAATQQIKKCWEQVEKTGLLQDITPLRQTAEQIAGEILTHPSPLVSLAQIRLYDDYLFAHSVDVAILAVLTGTALRMNKKTLVQLGLGGLLHDIGKIRVPREILNKPGRLTAEEFSIIKKHTVHAGEILRGYDSRLVAIATQHHERVDGSGYPYGLHGRAIDPLAQIVSIADVFDAMTTDRVYRPALPVHEVVEYLLGSGGQHFELTYINAFLQNIAAFPVGSTVRLCSGAMAIVQRNRRGLPLYPLVRVLTDKNGRPVEPYELDLLQARLTISAVLNGTDKNSD